MSRPLYIDGARPVRILRDGPALRVRRAGEADRLYPFRRLGRVVVFGRVDWDIDALMGCAEQGVPVEFMERDGRRRARLMPVGGEQRPLVDLWPLLERLAAELRGIQRYQLWVAREDMAARLALRRTCRWSHCPVDAVPLGRLIRQRALTAVRGADLSCFDARLKTLVMTQVDSLLRRHGVDPEEEILQAAGIRPVKDMAEILSRGWQLDKLRFLKKAGRSEGRRSGGKARLPVEAAVRFFEARAASIWESAQGLMVRFHAFLLEGVSHGDA